MRLQIGVSLSYMFESILGSKTFLWSRQTSIITVYDSCYDAEAPPRTSMLPHSINSPSNASPSAAVTAIKLSGYDQNSIMQLSTDGNIYHISTCSEDPLHESQHAEHNDQHEDVVEEGSLTSKRSFVVNMQSVWNRMYIFCHVVHAYQVYRPFIGCHR